jgi:hypothetical protein
VSSSLATEYGPYTDVIIRVIAELRPFARVGALAASPARPLIAFNR